MPPMFGARFPCAKGLAIVLPLCVLGSFMACLWLCSSHHDTDSHTCHQPASAAMGDLSETEHCSIATGTIALPEKRSSVNAPTEQLAEHESKVFSLTDSSNDYYPRLHRAVPLSTSDPPLELLCVFRI
jgi:hypothetical protein